jgi:hypothetical protein
LKSDSIKTEFENLATRLGYTIRYEKGYFQGGYCRLKNENIIIMNQHLETKQQNIAFSRLFQEFDLSNIQVLPILRFMIEDISGE